MEGGRLMFILAKKEMTDAFRNKLFITLLSMLLLLITVSVVLGSIQVKINVESYNQSISILKSLGKTELPPPPSFNPLSESTI
jgi:ABC-2 type transport system permease protein